MWEPKGEGPCIKRFLDRCGVPSLAAAVIKTQAGLLFIELLMEDFFMYLLTYKFIIIIITLYIIGNNTVKKNNNKDITDIDMLM